MFDVVTPIASHARLAFKFAKKGKKVLVEKPLLMNKAQQREFNQIIKKNKNAITISYPYKFSQSLDLAHKIVKSKSFGNINYITVEINQCGRFMKYGVNHLLGPHAISIISIFYNINKVSFNS